MNLNERASYGLALVGWIDRSDPAHLVDVVRVVLDGPDDQ